MSEVKYVCLCLGFVSHTPQVKNFAAPTKQIQDFMEITLDTKVLGGNIFIPVPPNSAALVKLTRSWYFLLRKYFDELMSSSNNLPAL